MKEIKLAGNKYITLVDDTDYAELSKYIWRAKDHKNGKVYARATVVPFNRINMEKFILGVTGIVDHKDGDTLNNQRYNLRLSTYAQNRANASKVFTNGTSKYRGVSWHKKTKKWCAGIKVNYKSINLGYFEVEENAALAYNNAAIKYFGEFANLNKI